MSLRLLGTPTKEERRYQHQTAACGQRHDRLFVSVAKGCAGTRRIIFKLLPPQKLLRLECRATNARLQPQFKRTRPCPSFFSPYAVTTVILSNHAWLGYAISARPILRESRFAFTHPIE